MAGLKGALAEVRPSGQEVVGSEAHSRWGDVTRRLLGPDAESVGDEDLIAVLLGTEAECAAAFRSAHALLQLRGGLKGVAQSPPATLEKLTSPGGAERLLGSIELGRRILRCREIRPRLGSPREIHRHLAPRMSARANEVFHVLGFNTRNILLGEARVAEGSANACPVDPRAVFRAALEMGASAIVVSHNHPSGDPEPSDEDIFLTRQLCEAGESICVRVLDHIVVGDDSYVSLLERGLMPTQAFAARTRRAAPGGRP